MKTSRRIAVPALLLATMATLAGGYGAVAAKSTGGSAINIGAIFSLTGSAGIPGTGRLQGVEVAVQDINAAGGILGRKVNLITQDTASDPVDATTAARLMLATDNLSMVTGLTALDYPGALKIFCKARPPMVMFENVADPLLDSVKYQYCYRAVPSDALEGTSMVLAASRLGYKKIALAFTASAESATILPSIKAAAHKLGISIVATPQLPVGVPSYDSEVLSIVAAHPTAILASLLPSDAATFFSSLERLGGSHIPVIGSDTSLVAQWVSAVGAGLYARQVVGVQPSAGTNGPGASAFFPVFQKKFGQPAPGNSAEAYDSVIVGALAMEACRSTQPATYNKCILKVTTPGAGATPVYSYAQGLRLLKADKKIKYYGIASPMIYNKFHAITGPFEVDRVVNGQTIVKLNLSAVSLADVIK